MLLSQRPYQTRVLLLAAEKKGMSTKSRYVKEIGKEFLFGAKKPIFSGTRGLHSLSEAS